ncbi:outer membrane beta-barrel protein [Pedobacter sp. KBS0701]|uniref:outer membrane beta-barrel family protein n=1 Tax=Pedobacter sp. KBS0701 TaxID=2578106 RepID=UPI00110E6AB2|nr:outer membrane beta-barrel family protein [Pedobacter sp. KBS0701]QDW24732.1 outer membrane beta-barrel protein [Pedobacter sp. KBS0701]
MRLLLLIFCALICCSPLFAQQSLKVAGSIRDSSSLKQIPGAVVLAKITGPGFQTKTSNLITNSEGSYSLNIPRNHQLSMQINSIGYKSKIIDLVVNRDTTINILLGPAIIELKEVKITDRSKGQLKLVPGGFNIITDTKAFSPSTFVSTYLKYVPGITVSPKGSISFLGNDLKVYVDGIFVNLSGQDLLNYLHQLTVTDLASIDILTEPGASYDANSGSIINFRTKKFLAVGLQNILGLGLTTHDKAYVNNSMQFSRGKFRIVGSVLANHSNFYDNTYSSLVSSSMPNINSEQVLNLAETPQNNLGLDLRVDYRVNKSLQTGFDISTDFVSSNYDYSYHIVNNNVAKSIATNFDSDDRRTKISGYFQVDLKKGQFQIDFSHINQNGNSEVINNLKPLTNPGSGITTFNSTRNENYFINLKQTHKFSDKLSITAGLKYTNNRLNNNFSPALQGVVESSMTDYKEDIYAAFIESSLTTKKFSFQIGLRAEHTNLLVIQEKSSLQTNKITYSNLFPNVVFVIPKLIGIKTHIFFNSGISRPNYSQYLPFPENFNLNAVAYNVGNVNLKAATTYGYGLKFNKNFEKDYSIIAILKNTKGINPVISLPFIIQGSIFNAPVNLNDINVYGLTLILSKQWKSSSITVSPVYEKRFLKTSDVAYENQNLSVSLNGINYFAIHANYNFEPISKFYASVNISYGTRQNQPVGIQRGSGYSSINVSRGVFKDKLSVSLELSDPFNWSRNFTYQNFNGVSFDNQNKPETRMLYFSASYTIGRLKRSKASSFSFEDDSRLEEFRK